MKIIVDEMLWDFSKIYFNPGINTETYEITGAEFVKALKSYDATF